MTLRDYDIAILCGGRGKRLSPLTKYTPKCLLDIMGKPFLEILLDQLIPLAPHHIYLCTGWLHEEVAAWKKSYAYPLTLVNDGKEQRGDAYPLTLVPFTTDRLIVLNGDTYASMNWVEALCKFKAPATTYMVGEFGRKYTQKKECFRIVTRETIESIREDCKAPPYPTLATALRLISYTARIEGQFYDYGTPRRYKDAHYFFRSIVNVEGKS